MAEKHFSWLPEEVDITDRPAVDPAPDRPLRRLAEKVLVHKQALIVVGGLIIILFVLKVTQKSGDEPKRFEIVAANLPIPKGTIIEGMLVSPAYMNPFSFSKTQKLNLLTVDGAQKVMGKVRAKKGIAPQAPLFWSDLELLPEPKITNRPPTPTILYPEVKP